MKYENRKYIVMLLPVFFVLTVFLYFPVVWVFGSLFFQFILGFTLALLLRKPFRGRGIYTGFVFYAWALSGLGFLMGSSVWQMIFCADLALFKLP